jgi:carnitine 3-dehydrogenase
MAEPEHLPAGAALLGGGLIGGGWAARLVLAGVDVRLFDPAAEVEPGVRAQIDRARRAWRRLTTAPLPPEGTLTVVDTVEQAVHGAELIQESAPEREPLKRDLLAQASEAAGPDAIIATSTSGLLPSRLSADMDRPDRFVVGHPFNPVYLLPLIEVCAGDRTSPETVTRAAAIYRGLGMRPLVVRHEIDAFIADRLQHALWREALWLVADDVATAEEIDDAIRFGPGLRWAAMGSFLTFRLGGGPQGMRHFLAQFGPVLELPWTKLTEVPELDERLIEKIVGQSDAQADGRDVEELTRIRDDCLVSVLLALKGEQYGAGEEIARAERRWLDRAPAERSHDDADAGSAPGG